MLNPLHARPEELIAEASDLLNEVRWSLPGYVDRVDEMTGRFPGGGSGLGGGAPPKGSHSDPTFSAPGSRDPGRDEKSNLIRDVRVLHQAVLAVYGRWDRGRLRTTAPARLKDPGCELCTNIPAKLPDGTPGATEHWCPSYCSIDRPARKGDKTIKIRVCSWCYQFKRRQGRVPNLKELVAHSEGRRVTQKRPLVIR